MPPERRTDLDWLRISAFGLLILFHTGAFYAPGAWEVKSPRTFAWLTPALEWSLPWRLLLLFLISGAASSFMCRRLTPPEFLRSRTAYLFPPLLFAVVVASPPQVYFTLVERYGYADGFWAFLGSYFEFYRPFCVAQKCLFLPTWEHLWFVAYLWIYTALLACGLMLFGPALLRLREVGSRYCHGWRLLVIPAFALAFMRIGLEHFFPETHGLTDDWYLHAVFFSGFLFGFVILPSRTAMAGFEALRWVALLIGLVSYVLRSTYAWHYRDGSPIPIELKVIMAVVYGFDQWAWVAAALGFGSRLLVNRDGATRRYLTEAVFPYYIVHQTALVVAAHELVRLDLPIYVEAPLLIASCVAICAISFEIVRRISWLRPWFGLKPKVSIPRLPARPSARRPFALSRLRFP